MKKMVSVLAFVPLMALAATSTPKGFTDNLDEALATAKAEGKYVYACFSGSDWCGWCKRLEGEVLSKPEFVPAVEKDYVLVYIDMPNDKNLLSERAKTENPKLVKQYKVRGFPTALILDGEGKTVSQTGYRAGGPEKYAKHLRALRRHAPEIARLPKEIDGLVKQLQALENEE